MSFEKKEYADSEALQRLAVKIISVLPELNDATKARFKVFFSSAEPEHIGGKCRKLDGAVRYQTKMDFFILIHRKPFVEGDEFQKMRILVHELYHIETEKGAFKNRRHDGDFCEIAAHDKWSYRLAVKAMSALGIKYDDTEEIRKWAGIELAELKPTDRSPSD